MYCQVNDKEFASVIALPAAKRYEYFIKKVADWEELWSIGSDDEWCLVRDDQGQECVPVWPANRYAKAYCSGEWKDSQPKQIPLSNWLTRWISGMSRDGRHVAVFPTPDIKGIVITPERLKVDLENELEDIE